MTRNVQKSNKNKPENINQDEIKHEKADHLFAYETKSSTETRKLCTAVIDNTLKFMIMYKTIVAQVHQDVRNGSHAFECALPEIEKVMKTLNTKKLALSTNDFIFTMVGCGHRFWPV